ncbi:MAG: hypothetical protein FJ333_08170 [Sphingomonadales bacterium]|nr:hypothetical protein [Sphingomonadales bacterium]
MSRLLLCAVFVVFQQSSGEDWQQFFSERCNIVSTPENAKYCPTYRWDPTASCFPWDTEFCELTAIVYDPNCEGIDCKVN